MSLNSGETLQPFKPLNQLIYDSAGNLIGIQNDRANGSDLRIGGGSGVDGTFATLVATTALKLNSGATFDLYNTADQTTNYERLRADWLSNVVRVFTQNGGTGTARNIQLGTGSGTSIARYFEVVAAGAATSRFGFVGIDALSSGTHEFLNLEFTANQSGTAGYTVIDANVTEAATGSGTKLLQRWAVGGTSQAQVTNLGSIFGAAITACAGGFLGLATGAVSAASADVRLERDAAQTLALRLGTNAQTFRVYNTYTDASNYERGGLFWSSNVLFLQTEQAGTGTARAMKVGTVGATSLTFKTNNADQWLISSSGHFVAGTDNTVDIGQSGANRPRNLYMASWIRMATTTVASLPAAGTAAAGARMFVTDANATTFASVVAGGGANTVPVYSDGTDWRIG